MAFFELWIGQKLQTCSYGGNPPVQDQYLGLNSLTTDFATFLGKDQSYFQSDSAAKDFSAKVQGVLTKTTQLGFPHPKGALEQLTDFVNGIISAFMDAINSILSIIVGAFTSVVNFVLTVWDKIVGPVLGTVIEAVKSIVNMVIGTIISALINPILSTDLITTDPINLTPINSTTSIGLRNDISIQT